MTDQISKYNVIFNKDGHAVYTGKNLAVFTRHAKKLGGVQQIEIASFYHGMSYQFVGVAIKYANGFIGKCQFADLEVAKQWAAKKVAIGGSNWASCKINIYP